MAVASNTRLHDNLNLVRWCHKGPKRLDNRTRIIESRFQKIGFIIDDIEMKTHILSNLHTNMKTLLKTLNMT